MKTQIIDFNLTMINSIIEIDKLSFEKDSWSFDIFFKEYENKSLFRVLTIDDNIVGYYISKLIIDEMELITIAINPKNRKEGFGSLLIDDLILYGKINNFEKIFLEVRESNVPAKNLYLKKGFKKMYIRKKYYADGENADIMMLECKEVL